MADVGQRQRRSLWRVMRDAFRHLPGLGIADPSAAERDYEHLWSAFDAEMAAGGYREWRYTPPIGHDEVQCRRFEWPRSWVIRLADCDPQMNVAGLYWRSHGPTIEAHTD